MLSGLVEHAPAVGYYFLALHGSQESLETIFNGLQHPRTSEYAEEAWWLSTGQTLPKVPRISVVGEDESSAEKDEEIGFIPDAIFAEKWWSENANKPITRWLAGESHSLNVILNLLNSYTGQISKDLFDLYAFTVQTPLQIGHYNWHAVRLHKINAMQENDTPKQSVQHA